MESTSSIGYERRWWTLMVLSLSMLVIALDNTILNVALPTLVTELDASGSDLQWIVDSYVLVFAGLLLVMGSLGDRFGRKLALYLGFVIFGGASLLAAYSGSSEMLITGRALMGIGGALIMPATLSILVNVFPKHERAKAIAIWSAAAGIGVPLGPVAGGWLLDNFWWGSVFLVNVPVIIGAMIVGFWLVPESKDEHAPRIDIPGGLLSIAGLATLLYAIIEAPETGWLDPSTLIAFVAAAVLIAGVRLVGTENRGADAADRLLSQHALHGRRGFDQSGLLCSLRFDLPPDAVPPVRHRLHALRGRCCGCFRSRLASCSALV